MRHHVIPALGKVELGRLRPSDVEALTMDMLDRGLAPGTAALTRRVLVVALTDAERDGLVVRNVARLARAPRQRDPPRSLTAAEVRTLTEAARYDPMGSLVLLALSTGLRRGELVALRWDAVGPDSLTVNATMAREFQGGYERADSKTRRSRRTVGLPAMARAALDRQRLISGEGPWVFPDPVTGRPARPDGHERMARPGQASRPVRCPAPRPPTHGRDAGPGSRRARP